MVDSFERASRALSHNDLRSSATVWLWNGGDVRENELRVFADRLSPSEKRRFASFARPFRRRQFLLGRMLLRLAVARLTGLTWEQVFVLEKVGQPPQLMAPKGKLAPKFTLSHSGDWLACAVSAKVTLGLDVELNQPNRAFTDISAIAFRPDEDIWFKSQPDNHRMAAFYALWCAREASYKFCCNLRQEYTGSRRQNSLGFQKKEPYLYRLPVGDLGLTGVLSSHQPLSVIQQINLRQFHHGVAPGPIQQSSIHFY